MKLLYASGYSTDLPTALNFGCGSNIQEDMINLDIHIEESDVALAKEQNTSCLIMEGDFCSPSGLPIGHFERVVADMVFEHIHIDVIPSVLYSLHNVMASSGELSITVPNFTALASMWISRTTNNKVSHMELLREITYQLLDPSMGSKFARGHQSLWTRDFAHKILGQEGFDAVSVDEKGPNGIFLSILAVKPSDNPYSVAVNIL